MIFNLIPKRVSRYCGFRRAAPLGNRKTPERLVTATRYMGAQSTIEGTVTTRRLARRAAARTAFAEFSQHCRSDAPYHFRRVVVQATVVGALTFGLDVAPLTDFDVRLLHGCLVSLLYKFWGLPAFRFDRGRIVAKISAEKAMQRVGLRPLSETLRVRRLLRLLEELF